ncbi:MAG TPA: pyridoxamine 5'-phosphate oxidase [Ignavibacteria bacterium]|nr:pyridoxamine 5'-phosphate oxidase [Ignavibacteria bacterium]
MIHKELENIRRNYKLKSLDTKDVDLNPFVQFNIWFEEMLKSNLIEPTAVILATASKQGKPSARTLLLKSYDETGFVYYSNYESTKGKELAENNQASLLFYWPELERQIRIEGKVEKVSQKESEKYFKTRPFKSKVGAWASNQSTIINSRLTIVKKFLYYLAKFHSKDIPLPPYWGGYRLVPEYFEFWQGRANRLHDRVIYQKSNDTWKIDRLSP